MKRHEYLIKRMAVLLAAGLMLGALAFPASTSESGEQARPVVKLKSEKMALTLSLVGTLIPWAVAATYRGHEGILDSQAGLAQIGLLATPLGPSLGYFYAGSTGRGLAGIGIRLIGLAGIVGGAFGNGNADANNSLMTGLIIAGGCVFAASTIYDIVNVKKAVRRRNLRAEGMSMAVAPVLSPKTKTYGLQLQLGF